MLPPIDETVLVDENEQNVNQTNSIAAVQNDNRNEQEPYSEVNYFDGNERSVIINESQPLARYSVLYLGTAIPSVGQRGIDSIQEPISKRYPIGGSDTVRGIEAWLSVDENGLQIQFASDPTVVLYYPIRSLVYCASVRFATQTETEGQFPTGWRFVPLDSPDANLTENMQNPPLFTVTFHRTRHLPTDECHCFVTKTKQIALALVEACSNAYQATDSEQDCSKVPLYFKVLDDGSQMKEIDDEISLIPAVKDEPILDYQINNKAAGFFYKTNQALIDYWQLWENPKHGLRRPSSAQSTSSSSSRSSNRHRRHRRLASITSIPEVEKPSEVIQTTNNYTIEPPQLMLDPYAPDPNVIRVERIKDVHTGRDVFIRWLKDPAEQVPTAPTPNYDFHVDFDTDYQFDFDTDSQFESELSNDIQGLVLDDRLQATEHRKSPKKEKHRKHKDHHKKKHSPTHEHHQHPYIQYVDPTIFPLIQQEFQMPSFDTTFSNIQLPSQPNSAPFWFYPM